MKILVTGRHGQVGWELMRSLAVLGEVIGCDRSQADFADPQSLSALVEQIKPNVIVNAAAYTAVDQAQTEEALATRINGEAVAALAKAAQHQQALLIHYSTDYVFDGTKVEAYTETDMPAPLNVYGRSKLLGEQAVQTLAKDWLIFRTSWVYAARGRNFLRTILKLATERETLQIVSDQLGAPTCARTIADLTAHAVRQAAIERRTGSFASGIFNLTAAGSTSWYGFAEAVLAYARRHFPQHKLKLSQLEPILSSAYPTAAKRPKNSRLTQENFIERFKLCAPDWQQVVHLTLEEMLQK